MYYLYLLQCCDGSLYCGITTEPERRLAQHNAGTAARYTRSRLPVTMVATAPAGNRSAALKLEMHVKKLPARRKLSYLADLASRTPAT